MEHLLHWQLLAFQNESSTISEALETTEPKEDKRLRCLDCRTAVTAEKYRIAVSGSHGHRFFNPSGILFHIGFFAETTNLQNASPPSGEFTWFPGTQWQVSICATCTKHLGWFFQTHGGGHFWGLVLNRLTG